METENNFYLITEYCNGGSLQSYLDRKGQIPENEAIKIIHQLIQGCQALYSHKFMHRDLKFENILI